MVGEGSVAEEQAVVFQCKGPALCGLQGLPGAGSFPAGSCSVLSLVPTLPQVKHARNRNGEKNTQQALWAEGAELWHSATRAW